MRDKTKAEAVQQARLNPLRVSDVLEEAAANASGMMDGLGCSEQATAAADPDSLASLRIALAQALAEIDQLRLMLLTYNSQAAMSIPAGAAASNNESSTVVPMSDVSSASSAAASSSSSSAHAGDKRKAEDSGLDDANVQQVDVASNAAASSRVDAPAAKVARIAGSTVTPLPDPRSPSSMLCWLLGDQNTPGLLYNLLSLRDLGLLHCTCRAWRDSSGIFKGRCTLALRPSVALPFFMSPWLQCVVGQVSIDEEEGETGRNSIRVALRMLNHFPHARQLTLQMNDYNSLNFDSIARGIEDCFGELALRLRVLSLRMSTTRDASKILPMLPALQKLEQLTLELPDADTRKPLNFEPLTRLPSLQKLTVRLTAATPILRCSKEQVICLAGCRKLTWLSAGTFSANCSSGGLVNSDALMAQRVDDGIGTLVHELLSAHADPERAVLAHLDLTTTEMTRSVWQYVRLLKDLEELQPLRWDAAITPAEWGKLAAFKDLRQLSLPIRVQQWPIIFPMLLNLTHLHTLSIACERLTIPPAEMLQLFGLPLQSLALAYLRIGDVKASLEHLPASCHTLRLLKCVDLQGQPMQVRNAFLKCNRLLLVNGKLQHTSQPYLQLPHLLHLDIQDIRQLNRAEATRLNHSVFWQCPRLRSDRFSQNLKG